MTGPIATLARRELRVPLVRQYVGAGARGQDDGPLQRQRDGLTSRDPPLDMRGHGRGLDVHVIAEAELQIARGIAVIAPGEIGAGFDGSPRGIDASLDSVPDGGRRLR
jgi:hypothetical protein